MMRLWTRVLGIIIGNPEKKPIFLQVRCAKWFVTVVVCIATATDIFLYSVVVPVLPFALTQRMHVEHARVQFWTSAMLAIYGGFLLVGAPIFGIVADRTATRRAPLLCGLALLAGATVMLCVARSLPVFIIGRALQGLSGALVWTTGLALLVDTVGKDGIGVALGYVGAALSISILLGPMLGGIVYQKAGYYAVFAICFALLGVDVFFRLVLVERKVAKQWLDFDQDKQSAESKAVTHEEVLDEHRNDDEEAGFETVANKPGLDAVIKTTPSGTLQSTVSESPDMPAATSTTAEAWQQRLQRRNLPAIVHLLINPRFLVALYANFAAASLLTAFDSTLPIFVHQTFHWSSIGGGLIFLPIFVPAFLAPIAGWAIDRFGPKWLAVTGFLIGVPFLVLLRLVDHDSIGQKVLLCGLLFGYGAGCTMALMALMAEIAYAADAVEQKGVFGPGKSAYAQAYGLFNTVYAAGMLVGPIWGGGVKDTMGFGSVGWTLAILAFVTAFACLFFTGGIVSWNMFWTKRFKRDTKT